jgi:cysteine desulfurase
MIYLDYNATYPSSIEHFNKVARILSSSNANPSSTHQLGRKTKLAIEKSRVNIAKLLEVKPECLSFNSGATEANNTIIYQQVHNNNNPVIAVSLGEHPSVLSALKYFSDNNLCTIKTIDLNNEGTVDFSSLEKILKKDNITAVFLNHVNNEVGCINPAEKITNFIKAISPKTYLHFDMVQSFAKLDLTWLGSSLIDSVSISAHKVGGFKGIGALYQKVPKLSHPLILGGLQENGIRAGTENLPGIISFGLKAQEIKEDNPWAQVEILKSYFLEKTKDLNLHFNINPKNSINNTLNFYLNNLEANQILLQAENHNIHISSKSACSSGLSQPSAILLAMGLSETIAANSIRVSFGPESKEEDVNSLISMLKSLPTTKT